MWEDTDSQDALEAHVLSLPLSAARRAIAFPNTGKTLRNITDCHSCFMAGSPVISQAASHQFEYSERPASLDASTMPSKKCRQPHEYFQLATGRSPLNRPTRSSNPDASQFELCTPQVAPALLQPALDQGENFFTPSLFISLIAGADCSSSLELHPANGQHSLTQFHLY